jgi:TatD DNase family protein
MSQYIDIHCHPNFKDYDPDRALVLERMKEYSVLGICVGTDVITSKESIELAEEHPFLYSSVGLHPTHANEGGLDELSELAKSKKVVAVGECGLDYFRRDATEEEKEFQRNVFKKHIDIALENNLPLMVHCRPSKNSMDAYEDILNIISEHPGNKNRKLKGNIHFFVGDKKIAEQFLDLGFTMSFTGVITFTSDYDDVIRFLPLDRILSETDAPFVSPVPHRGKRNEPVFVIEVVKRIAEIRNESLETVQRVIMANALRTFNLNL